MISCIVEIEIDDDDVCGRSMLLAAGCHAFERCSFAFCFCCFWQLFWLRNSRKRSGPFHFPCGSCVKISIGSVVQSAACVNTYPSRRRVCDTSFCKSLTLISYRFVCRNIRQIWLLFSDYLWRLLFFLWLGLFIAPPPDRTPDRLIDLLSFTLSL